VAVKPGITTMPGAGNCSKENISPQAHLRLLRLACTACLVGHSQKQHDKCRSKPSWHWQVLGMAPYVARATVPQCRVAARLCVQKQSELEMRPRRSRGHRHWLRISHVTEQQRDSRDLEELDKEEDRRPGGSWRSVRRQNGSCPEASGTRPRAPSAEEWLAATPWGRCALLRQCGHPQRAVLRAVMAAAGGPAAAPATRSQSEAPQS
jgi:hypothetical protein